MELSEPWTPGEARRAVVDRYLSLRTEMQEALSRIAAVAARTCQAPMAAVSFVGDDHVWFSGRVGLPLAEASADPGLCATAILHTGPYVLIDARADPRAARHPMVHGDPWVRYYAAAPVVVDGAPIGAVCVMDTEPRRARPDELATLRDLAAMAATELQLRRAAIDAISHEQEARSLAEAEAGRVGHIAETLQNSLTPSQLPPIPGLDVAVFYQPHSADEIGGDFFDVFPVDHNGRWGVFVGDVVGKGVEAAAFISLARYSIRTAAVVQPWPADVLAAVNDAVLLDPAGDETIYCTVAYGEFVQNEEGTWRVTLAVGGHPPPLVIRTTEVVESVEEGGTIIGSFANQEFSNTQIDLGPGDTLVFYTDGVTELPTREGWLGVDGLRAALEDHPVNSASEAVDLLRSVVATNGRPLRDDLVIVAVTVPRELQQDGNMTFAS